MNRPTIYLDIDGVLNSRNWYSTESAKSIRSELIGNSNRADWHAFHMPVHHMKILNKIAKVTGAKLVITSAWRMVTTMGIIRNMMRRSGLDSNIQIDRTVSIRNRTRGTEIDEHIKLAGVTNFLIIDDEKCNVLKKHRHRLIKTDCNTGLLPCHFITAINVLNHNE